MWETVRKFGLEHCDLPTMMWNVALMLRGLTLNIYTRYEKGIPSVFYITTSLLAACYLYTYFISMIWFVFVRCLQTRDLTAAMIVFSLGITSEIGAAKFINAYFYRRKICNLVQEYLDYDSSIASIRFTGNLLRVLRVVKRRALFYVIVIVCNGIVYIFKPMVMPGRNAIEDIFILYKLEPEFETPNYELSYFLSAAGTFLTCYLALSMAAFLVIAAGYVEAQLLALSKELVNLWTDVERKYLENFERHDDKTQDRYDAINKDIEARLKNIVTGHTKTISLLYQLEDIFRPAFAFEFLILSVGLIAELLGGLENTYMQIPFATIQVGMDCLTGQRVIDASLVFENAVYSCNWERFDASNMRVVLVMLINSQRSLKLSAGGIAVLSFVTLMSVLKSVYSAFTTLQSVV
uniref:Odorant receptor n=1 Tax=Glyphodes pyloalis TaxID=1242752 RepID=A0A6M3GUI0_GLYPY|nr:olfactory receptor [Glyphodes pyloalis]